ncbi:hypothetical protein [Lysinibacillus sp. CTST325]
MKFIKIKLKSEYDMKIENIVSVTEEEKGIRVHTAEGCEFFAPYENVLYYSKSAERQLSLDIDEVIDRFSKKVEESLKEIQDESPQITINCSLSKDDIEELKSYGALEIKKPS